MAKRLFFVLILGFCSFLGTTAVRASVLTELPRDCVNVPIIMYHTLSNNSGLLSEWTITPQEFEEDLQFLQSNGFEPVFMEELINYVYYGSYLPEKPVVLTFDDGDSSCHRYVLPLLEEYKMKAGMSIIGEPTDDYSAQNRTDLKYYPHITWKQINEMTDTGLVEVLNHSYNMHSGIGAKMKKDEGLENYRTRLSEDLLKMQESALLNTGKELTVFTYPFGSFSTESVEILKELGFKASLTCCEGSNDVIQNDPQCLYSMNRFIRPHGMSLETIFEINEIK